MTLQEAKKLWNNDPTVPKTWDKYTDSRILQLDPLIRKPVASAINECHSKGYDMRIGYDGHSRSFDMQDQLYGYSRTREQLQRFNINPDYAKPFKDKKTNARGGQSYHNYKLAVDVYRIVKSGIGSMPKEVIAIFKKYGFETIPDDDPHFQMTFGYTWQDLLKMHNDGLMNLGFIVF